uniref:PLAT domain-containing protein n=1 Tax=Xenopus tropicalis TaxID=8364 RepID=A0A803J699_XENTR
MFSHNEWFVCKSDREFTEAIIPLKEISANVTKVKSFSTTTKGKWQLKVLGTNTGEEKEDLSIVVFGKQGKSPKQKVKNLNYEPFMLNIEGIGEIIKISFLYKTGRKVQLHKVRLKDMDTKQEIGFYIKHISHEDGMESVTELAAVLPNIQPLTDVSYSVNIKTSNFPASDTEADVFITIYGGNGDTCQRKLTPLSYPGVLEKGEVNVFKIKAVDLGMLTKVHIEHKAVGYGAGWFLDQITIEDSQNKGPKYVFPCQQWLDSSIGDKQTSRNLKLLGKVNRTTKRLHKGTVDIFVSTSDVSNGSAKCAVFLTICCEKGNYDPVIFARGSLKQGVTIESSVDLSQNLGAIRKVRLQMEDDASEESWYCKEVLLQHKQTKDRLEFPFCQHFTSDGNNLVAELPALFPDGPISTVKTYTIFITTAQSSKKTTDASMFITLHGNLGDSGQRKFLFKGNVSGKQQGSGFQLEAVDLGVIQELTISQEKQTIFQLEKVVVEEEMLIKKSYVFMAQQWEQKDNKMMAMTLQVTETIEQNNSLAMLNGSNRMASDGEWNICLNEFNKEEHTEPAEYNIVILLYGEKGKSKPFVLKRKEGSQVKGILSYKLNLKYDLGLLYKVRLGLEDEKDRGALSFFYFKMQHTKTMDTFLYSNKTRPLSFDEDRWIEFPVEWPLRSSLSVVKYTVAVFCPDMLSWKDGSYMSVCLHGKNGDTGDRRLAWHNSQGTKDEVDTFKIATKALGRIQSIDIGHDGKGFGSGWFLDKVEIIHMATNSKIVFMCNRWLAEDENDGRTRITLYS